MVVGSTVARAESSAKSWVISASVLTTTEADKSTYGGLLAVRV